MPKRSKHNLYYTNAITVHEFENTPELDVDRIDHIFVFTYVHILQVRIKVHVYSIHVSRIER